MVSRVGKNAGSVWNYLHEHPGVPLKQISKELRLKDSLTFMAIGWLAREGKLAFEENGKTTKVSLIAQ